MTFKSIGLVVALFLATLAGLNTNAYAFNIDEGVEGYWYEHGLDARRGWGLQYIRLGPEQGMLFVAGYVYDNLNEPIWVTGNAVVFDGQYEIEMPMMLLEGGKFGPEVGSPAVTNSNVVSLRIVFNSCNSADFHFTGEYTFSQHFDPLLKVVKDVDEGRCVYQHEFTSCPAFARPGLEERACFLSDTITEDIVLTNDIVWQLDGIVYVGSRQQQGAQVPADGPTLTIEAGARIEGVGPNTALVISRGSKIIAEGQPHAPIVMSGYHSTPEGAVPGDWGGLVINGAAPLNTCYTSLCEEEGEGGTGAYGGTDELDDSGTLRYVRVQYAGSEIDPMYDHMPGIALQGVGSGTVIDHVQVHASYDDGIKILGGTFNAKHLVVTDSQNDSVDWAFGYVGSMQYILVKQAEHTWLPADHMFSGENYEDDHDISPRTGPTIANATLIGRYDTTAIDLKEGSAGHFSNLVVLGSGECLDLDDDATFTAAGSPNQPSGALTFRNSIFYCNTDFVVDGQDPWSTRDFVLGFGGNSSGAHHGLSGFFPMAGSIALGDFELDPSNYGEFFEDAGFAGVFRSRDSAWHYGWTEFLDQ